VNKGAENRHVFDVFVHIPAFLCLEDLGKTGEARIIHQHAEPLLADLSLADMLMAVDTGAKFTPGVIDVDDGKSVKPDGIVEFPHCGFPTMFRVDGVPGRKQVARVKAHSNPLLLLDVVKNGAELLEPVSECGTLARGGFQNGQGTGTGGFLVHNINRLPDAPDAFFLTPAHMSAGVQDKAVQAVRFAPP
jgi:hypothetical protein